MTSARAVVIVLAALGVAGFGVGLWFVVDGPAGGSTRSAQTSTAKTEAAPRLSMREAARGSPPASDSEDHTDAASHAEAVLLRADALTRRLVEIFRGAPADEDEAERVEAELLELGEGAAVPLLAWLDREPGGAVRERLVDVLRKIPGEASEAGLIAEALSENSGASRTIAFEALAKRNTDQALAALNRVARTDPQLPAEPLIAPPIDPSLDQSTEPPDLVVFTARMKAMAALASTQDARVIPMLAAVLREEPDESLRMEAARNLGELRSDVAAVEALLAAAIGDRSQWVRLAALHALEGVVDPGLLEPLAGIAARDAHAGVRLLASQVLDKLREDLRLAELGR